MSINKYDGKHLNIDLRKEIENNLLFGKSLNQLSEIISKDPRTISKEIKLHRVFRKNSRSILNDKDHQICKKTERFPFVCNGCSKRSHCTYNQYFYSASTAEQEYRTILISSRNGLDLTEQEYNKIDAIISSGIQKGQSVSCIVACHKDEISCSPRTIYRMIDNQQLSVKAIDLRRKVRIKKRKKKVPVRLKNEANLIGRKYLDFLQYIANNPGIRIVQLDTIEGIKAPNEPLLLTIYFPMFYFMLAYIIESKDTKNVLKVFDTIQDNIGIDYFKELFPAILTDRGPEFSHPIDIEIDSITGEKRTRVFFCASYSSYQKGSIEKNHELIRYFIPKGTSLKGLTQDKIDLMLSHINSYSRKQAGHATPYNMMKTMFGQSVLDKIKIREINPDLITLKPSLLK